MPKANRAFLSQDRVDQWLAAGAVHIEGEVLRVLPDGPSFQLESAVWFRSEVTGSEDAHALCGKVKSLAALTAISGEHAPGSVVVGDNAYEITDGFLGELVAAGSEHEGTAALRALATLVNGPSDEAGGAANDNDAPPARASQPGRKSRASRSNMRAARASQSRGSRS